MKSMKQNKSGNDASNPEVARIDEVKICEITEITMIMKKLIRVLSSI